MASLIMDVVNYFTAGYGDEEDFSEKLENDAVDLHHYCDGQLIKKTSASGAGKSVATEGSPIGNKLGTDTPSRKSAVKSGTRNTSPWSSCSHQEPVTLQDEDFPNLLADNCAYTKRISTETRMKKKYLKDAIKCLKSKKWRDASADLIKFYNSSTSVINRYNPESEEYIEGSVSTDEENFASSFVIVNEEDCLQSTEPTKDEIEFSEYHAYYLMQEEPNCIQEDNTDFIGYDYWYDEKYDLYELPKFNYLRRKHKWQNKRANLAIKCKQSTNISNWKPGRKLFIHHQMRKIIEIQEPKKCYLPGRTLKDIDSKKGNLSSSSCKRYASSSVTKRNNKQMNIENKHLLTNRNADASLDVQLVNILINLQGREIMPEDYELLLQLDDRISPKTLERSIVDKLPSKSIGKSDQDSLCPICYETFECGNIVKILPCKHQFHKMCIETWLTTFSTDCPLDGQSVR